MGTCKLIWTGRTRGATREYKCVVPGCGRRLFDNTPPERIRVACRADVNPYQSPQHGGGERPMERRRWLPLPGDVLHWLIRWLTGQDVRTDCRCRERIRLLNEAGWRWAWRNRRTVYGWLRDEAVRREIEVAGPTFGALAAAGLKATWRRRFGRRLETGGGP